MALPDWTEQYLYFLLNFKFFSPFSIVWLSFMLVYRGKTYKPLLGSVHCQWFIFHATTGTTIKLCDPDPTVCEKVYTKCSFASISSSMTLSFWMPILSLVFHFMPSHIIIFKNSTVHNQPEFSPTGTTNWLTNRKMWGGHVFFVYHYLILFCQIYEWIHFQLKSEHVYTFQ